MSTVITHLIALIVGVVGGFLIGRKNPKVADAVTIAVDKAAGK
jgi:hypothetical protein